MKSIEEFLQKIQLKETFQSFNVLKSGVPGEPRTVYIPNKYIEEKISDNLWQIYVDQFDFRRRYPLSLFAQIFKINDDIFHYSRNLLYYKKFLGLQLKKYVDITLPLKIEIDGVEYSRKVFGIDVVLYINGENIESNRFIKLNNFYHIMKLNTTWKEIHIPSKTAHRFIIVTENSIYNEGAVISTKFDAEKFPIFNMHADDIAVLASANSLSVNPYASGTMKELKNAYAEMLINKLSGIA